MILSRPRSGPRPGHRLRRPLLAAALATAFATATLTAQATPEPSVRPGPPAPSSYLAQRAAVPAEKVAAARAAAEYDTQAGVRPVLRVPFRCNESWRGASRSGHSPSYWSLDFNWGAGDDDLGKPVKTSGAGVVVRSAYDAGGYGNYIEIDHGGGWSTLYAHLRAREVAVNARVSDSQRIGTVGGTGNVTGPHLHYEQIRDNVVVQSRFGQSNWATYPGPATYVRLYAC